MLDKLKPYFYFTLSERRGIAVLSLLIILLLIIRIFFVGNQTSIFPENIHMEEIELVKNESDSNNSKNINNPLETSEIFEFKNIDLNKANFDQLRAIGISRFAANNILKYRSQGGTFYQAEDLLKIYGVDSIMYYKVKDHLKITIVKKFDYDEAKPKKNFEKMEINSADSILLNKLPGIGLVLSKRIINYRKILGGYFSILQLKEVYGLSDEIFLRIEPLIEVDTTNINRINLNNCTFENLIKHPYLNQYQAKAIIKYRDLIGKYNSTIQLIDNEILSLEEYKRIEPYLVIE